MLTSEDGARLAQQQTSEHLAQLSERLATQQARQREAAARDRAEQARAAAWMNGSVAP